MVRAHQESLAIEIWPELTQGPYQAERFFSSRAIPALCLGQHATRVRHNSLRFPFPLAQHRPKAVSAGVHIDSELAMEVRVGEDGRRCKVVLQRVEGGLTGFDQSHAAPFFNSRCNGAAMFAKPLTNLR
ncbi:hypothetical protein T07_1706 [Trichinella nelsoni]|uniref:Uncharacterized protein n=1 Tax=Trichinella nelsoni TaxID=6336 RepID=A0A0V0SK76_9BILA|nr:hypothetical protein T07_1706 [Trichinella nelsoni]